MRNFIQILFCFAFTGCSLYAVNRQPEVKVSVSDSYSLNVANEGVTNLENGSKTQSWWESFDRPQLSSLINTALEANQELAQSFARLEQAQTMITQRGAERLPELFISGESEDRWIDSDEQGVGYEYGLEFNWEVDFFGRLQAAVVSGQQKYLAREADLEALKLAISAEIAESYFGAVAAHRRLALLNEQIKLDRKLLNLLELRFENGVGTNLDVLQQQGQLAESESLLPSAKTQLRIYENRLDVLLGNLPDGSDRVPVDETLDFNQEFNSAIVPAGLLTDRPDLRALKAELVAADANIAFAIASRLPNISLDGASLYSDTLSAQGLISSISASFIQPLLDWGKRKAEVKRNRFIYEEKLAQYTQRFLEAVEDVENALYQEKQQHEFLRRLENQRNILIETAQEAETRYTQGVDDYLPVLSSLQQLRRVEREMITQQFNYVKFRIYLHRAVGGNI